MYTLHCLIFQGNTASAKSNEEKVLSQGKKVAVEETPKGAPKELPKEAQKETAKAKEKEDEEIALPDFKGYFQYYLSTKRPCF